MSRRKEKKSESIEVRLPYSQKQAFMDACRDEGLTASEALRAEISEFLKSRARRSQRETSAKETWNMIKRNWKKTAGTLTSLAMGAAVFAAMPSSAEDALFKAYDKNGDGMLTSGEISKNDSKVFEVLDKNGDGRISSDEFRRNAEVTTVTDQIIDDEDKGEIRRLTVTTTSISLKEESQARIMVHEWSQDVDLAWTDEEVAAMIEEVKSDVNDLELMELEEMARVMEQRALEEEYRAREIGKKELEIKNRISGAEGRTQRIVIMNSDGEGLTPEGLEDIQRLPEKHGVDIGDGGILSETESETAD